MAKSEKIQNSLTIPGSISPLVQAFSEESEVTAKLLIQQAAAAIYHESKYSFEIDSKARPVTEDEVESVFKMMKAIYPVDMIEAIYAAQIVAGHLMGILRLAQFCRDDQNLGMKLLRLSNDAMDRLVKKSCALLGNTAMNIQTS